MLTRQLSFARFFKDYSPNGFADMQKSLSLLGLDLDTTEGHLRYQPRFHPLQLSYELVFVRHGETFGNCGQCTAEGELDIERVKANIKCHEQRVFQGNVDAEINQLTQLGKEQAENAALRLEEDYLASGWVPDVILHSPLSRAKDTGLVFVTRNNFADRYQACEGIREMSFGAWDNRRVCDFDGIDPCHSFYLNQNALVKKSGVDGRGVEQRAENFCDVLLRAYRVLMKLNNDYVNKKVLMFSHSMFGAACCILLGKGQRMEGRKHLAFDGKRKDGSSYTLSHAIPMRMNGGLTGKVPGLKR